MHGGLLPVNPYCFFRHEAHFSSISLALGLFYPSKSTYKVAQNLYVSQAFNKGFTFLLEGFNKAAFTFTFGSCSVFTQDSCSLMPYLMPSGAWLILMHWFIPDIYTVMSMNVNEQNKKHIYCEPALFVLLNNVGYADNRCPPIILSWLHFNQTALWFRFLTGANKGEIHIICINSMYSCMTF